MAAIPRILRKTKTVKRLREYMDREFTEVMHTTLNYEGPGVIRIHLIPPAQSGTEFPPSVAIINGTDILPVNYIWAVMLAELIKSINVYDGRTISEQDMEDIREAAAVSIKSRFPLIPRKRIDGSIRYIWDIIKKIAFREPVNADIGSLGIGDYADHMKGPHRMDIMVSAMTKNGGWNCNQKCVHCYAAGQIHSDEDELSTSDWKLILDKLRAANIPQVTFTGGEPTMREDLFELIAYSRWFITRLNTNGIKLTPEYCRELKKAELDSVQITFYSSDPAVHDLLVGAKQYENTVKGMENCLEAGIDLSVNTPLCTLNRNYLDTLRFLHEKGVIYVTCSGLITTGNATTEDSKALQLTEKEIEQILREAVAYCGENGMEIAFTSPGWIPGEVFDELGISSPACGACLSNMAVTPGGNIVPCQSWLSDEALGNMLRDDWESVWNSEVCAGHRNFSAAMTGRCPLRRYS